MLKITVSKFREYLPLNFDGINDGVVINNDNNFDLSVNNNFTFSADVKKIGDNQQRILQ